MRESRADQGDKVVSGSSYSGGRGALRNARQLWHPPTPSHKALVEYIHQTGAAWPVCKDPHGVPSAAACFAALQCDQQIEAGLFRRKRQGPFRSLRRVPGLFDRWLLSPPLQMQEVPDRGSTCLWTGSWRLRHWTELGCSSSRRCPWACMQWLHSPLGSWPRFEPVTRSILLVNVAQLHLAVHGFGSSTATLAKCSHLLQGSKAYISLCFANGGLQQTPARQVRHLD